MKIVIGFVNSETSIAVYDWDSNRVECTIPSSQMRSCGICYWNDEFIVASDNTVLRFSDQGRMTIPLGGPYESEAHSVHPINQDYLGVIDTGNSILLIFDRSGTLYDEIAPLQAWGDLPQDAVHLNDFVVTSHGILATCFDYRPWRHSRNSLEWSEWCQSRYGLMLNLDGHHPYGRGAILASGLNHPHSLVAKDNAIYHCCSATGELMKWQFQGNMRLIPEHEWQITKNHFLRGAVFLEGDWILGGSTSRHGERLSSHTALYRFNEKTGSIQLRELPFEGEIYELLPHKKEVLKKVFVG